MITSKNSILTEKILTNVAIKKLIESQPIDYRALQIIIMTKYPECIGQLIEDGLRYNLEMKFSGTRATAKSTLTPEKKEEIKKKYKHHETTAKEVIKAKAVSKIVDYTELYDEWKASDGTPIYAMTRAKLFKNADQLLLAVATTEKTAVFYQKLAERLGANQTVREGITAKKYHKIKEEVFQNGRN